MGTLQTAAWPEGVIGRYLTVGGATVDVTTQAGYQHRDDHTETVATCIGCGESTTLNWDRQLWNYAEERMVDEFDEGGRWSTPKAREWAQAHAEKCRAMPRPDGGV